CTAYALALGRGARWTHRAPLASSPAPPSTPEAFSSGTAVDRHCERDPGSGIMSGIAKMSAGEARTIGEAMRFNHIGIPTGDSFDGEIPLPHLKLTVSDHLNNPFGIQWQRYWDDSPVPDLVKTVPHVAFEVDDLQEALAGQHVIIEPNRPSAGVVVAFIEVNG